MKPDTKTFLEKVKEGHPIQTRNGMPAKFVVHVPDAEADNRLVVLVSGRLRAMMEDGRNTATAQLRCDIILAPKPKVKREGWVNCYPSPKNSSLYDGLCFLTSHAFQTEEMANLNAARIRIACCRIEWEEESE